MWFTLHKRKNSPNIVQNWTIRSERWEFRWRIIRSTTSCEGTFLHVLFQFGSHLRFVIGAVSARKILSASATAATEFVAEAKISHLECEPCIKQTILRFQISMSETIAMNVSNSGQQLTEPLARVLLRDRISIGQVIKKVAIGAVFKGHVHPGEDNGTMS